MRQNRHNAIFLIAVVLLTTALYTQEAAPQQSNLTGTPSAAGPAAHPATPAVPVAKAASFRASTHFRHGFPRQSRAGTHQRADHHPGRESRRSALATLQGN